MKILKNLKLEKFKNKRENEYNWRKKKNLTMVKDKGEGRLKIKSYNVSVVRKFGTGILLAQAKLASLRGVYFMTEDLTG